MNEKNGKKTLKTNVNVNSKSKNIRSLFLKRLLYLTPTVPKSFSALSIKKKELFHFLFFPLIFK